MLFAAASEKPVATACQASRTFKTASMPTAISGHGCTSGILIAAVALAGSPGPATLSLAAGGAAGGAAFGARGGIAYLAGIVVGMVAVMTTVASGTVGLLLALPGVAPVVAILAALYPGFTLLPDRLGADVALKLVMLALVIASVNVAWLLAGAVPTRFFRDPRTNRVINLVFAGALVASVVLAFLV